MRYFFYATFKFNQCCNYFSTSYLQEIVGDISVTNNLRGLYLLIWEVSFLLSLFFMINTCTPTYILINNNLWFRSKLILLTTWDGVVAWDWIYSIQKFIVKKQISIQLIFSFSRHLNNKWKWLLFLPHSLISFFVRQILSTYSLVL